MYLELLILLNMETEKSLNFETELTAQEISGVNVKQASRSGAESVVNNEDLTDLGIHHNPPRGYEYQIHFSFEGFKSIHFLFAKLVCQVHDSQSCSHIIQILLPPYRLQGLAEARPFSMPCILPTFNLLSFPVIYQRELYMMKPSTAFRRSNLFANFFVQKPEQRLLMGMPTSLQY
jgi:hypothetical protein